MLNKLQDKNLLL